MTTTPAPITLFTPYFAARTPERQRELDLCVTQNLRCDDLSRLVLLVDDGHRPPLQHPKLTVLDIHRRPTYADWLRLTREQGTRGISLLANSDIHFDASLAQVRHTLSNRRAFLALSRYELTAGELVPHPRPEWSQDVWGLHAEAKLPDTLMKALEVPLGVPRCDNKVAYLFAIHGWTLHNPQPLLRSVHVHETQQRHYDKTADLTVLGAVAYVHATAEAQTPSRVDIDVWALNTGAIGSVKLNRSLDNWAAERQRQAASAALPAPATQTLTPPTRPPGDKPDATRATPPRRKELAGPPPDVDLPVLQPADEPPALPRAEWHRFVTQGTRRWSAAQRFELIELDGQCLVLDWLVPDAAITVPADSLPATLDAPALLRLLVPPLLATDPITVADRPRTPDDLHFWQYPAATERQARDNHAGIAPGANQEPARRTVHTYLALPWATYIDKKRLPEATLHALGVRITSLRAIVRSLGWTLRVHTVCQQIHWRRIVDTFAACGITDLHLSHATTDIDPAREGWPFAVHSWPLIAPNIEDPDRRAGLVFGKPPAERRWLASFIGAYMPHYRSDVRLKLADAARASGREDVLVELTDLWHFNKVVYKEQVAGKALAEAERAAHDEATRRYNEVLSDSVFSLCPEGAGPNTLRVWESLAVGAIPVIVAPEWVVPRPGGVGPGIDQVALHVPTAALPALIHRLAEMSEEERLWRMKGSLELYRRYSDKRAF